MYCLGADMTATVTAVTIETSTVPKTTAHTHVTVYAARVSRLRPSSYGFIMCVAKLP